ncbi:hypothetical protein C8R46DRAFT_988708 [Mycena filopes]|nr:hypothetical protein C8R46DRAFT_988708 [Mycena filopes]
MAFSTTGSKKVAAHISILVLNLIVLILSARVNQYQDFFFIADRFPLILSIITFVLLGAMTVVDFVSSTSFTGRPQFEVGVLSVLGIFWLAFNAFSTSRWNSCPLNCSVIPSDFPDTVSWCQVLSALRVLVWVEWLMILFTAAFTLRFAISQNSRGNTHVFKTPLSRYTPNVPSSGQNIEYAFGSQNPASYTTYNTNNSAAYNHSNAFEPGAYGSNAFEPGVYHNNSDAYNTQSMQFHDSHLG